MKIVVKPILFLFLLSSYIGNSSASSASSASTHYPYPNDTKVILQKKDNGSTHKGFLRISNPGDKLWLVQSWTEDKNKKKHPYVFPSLTRLEPNESIMLTIIQPDSFSVLDDWVTVLFIPSEDPKSNTSISVPIAYRLKLHGNEQ